ncbi:ABC transporter permease [bacterium]|nr:ABC transporter permease [bacterium]
MSQVTLITPTHGWWDLGLAELWQARELLFTLIGRDLRVRYKNTMLGAAWAVLQPLLSTSILTAVFAGVLHLGTGIRDYLSYTLLGFTFWQFWSASVGTGANSVFEQIGMLKKVYFPRAFAPLTIVGRSAWDFGVVSVVTWLILLSQGQAFSWVALGGYLLGFFLLALFASGLALLLSIVNAVWRDCRHLIPFVLQVWFYVTPVFYDTSLLANRLPWLAAINPVAQILALVRTAVFDSTLDWSRALLLLLVGLLTFILGLSVFRQLEGVAIDRA